jgi:hypothetical protein
VGFFISFLTRTPSGRFQIPLPPFFWNNIWLFGMFVLSLLPIIKLLIMEIYFTVLIIMLIVFWVGWFLSNMDKKREDLWFKVSMTSGIVMFLMVVGIVLFSIWF